MGFNRIVGGFRQSVEPGFVELDSAGAPFFTS
jgi:hypothetical protein